MRLDIFDLELFLYVVETGSLTKGAQCASLSLQAASERIKKLEQQMSTALFIRHAQGVTLTLAGQTLLEQAQVLVRQAHQLKISMQAFTQQTSNTLTLWCNSSVQSEYLPALLPDYLVENPHIQIELQEAETPDIIQALEKQQARLGLISSFFPARSLQTLAFADDPLVLICTPDHPLTQLQVVELADIVDFSFVGLMSHYSLQQSIEAQARSLQAEIQYRLRLPNFAAIAQVVANGVGIAIIPKRAAQRLNQLYDFHQIKLQGAWANRKLLLAAANFDQLPTPYQHLSQYLMTHQQLNEFKS